METIVKTEPIIEQLTHFLNGEHLILLAKQSGFLKRIPRKLDPKRFLVALFMSVLQGTTAFASLAMNVTQLQGIRISKQAISKRMNDSLISFLECVLAYALKEKLQASKPLRLQQLPFTRILFQDSTNIPLPSKLSANFPGSKNWTKKDFSTVKIQAVYDMLQEQFVWFYFSPFTVNDQYIATTILDFVRRGDLIVRDLGYFVLNALTKLHQRGAYFITRFRYGIVLLDPATGERINLLNLLKRSHQCDCKVLLGSTENLKVRLVAVPVASEVAAERRRRLKTNRDRRLNPSKDHLALMGWDIFLVNVDADLLPPDEVVALYGLRWRIETIFKAWKSHFHKVKFPTQISARQVRVSLYALCIFVTIFHIVIVAPLTGVTDPQQRANRPLSLLRLSQYFKELFMAAVFFVFRPIKLFDHLRYYGAYDLRHDRLNYCQKRLVLS
ncbi:MAG: IS4 family transposase [Bacteroidota bacterium]